MPVVSETFNIGGAYQKLSIWAAPGGGTWVLKTLVWVPFPPSDFKCVPR